ncbi:MAG TPA: hypothetical protein VGR79_13280 [Stellaceae bacterium]|nr:hypothetical protein [Stellaceae bacterium]
MAPPHDLGERENVGDGEGDHGAARRQTRQLLGTGIGQGRKARTRRDFGFRHQAPQQRRDRAGAEEHRLAQAARVQQSVGEDVATLAVAAQLDLVDRKKIDRPVQRHRFDGADEIARIRRDDLFLAGDQRDSARALEPHHAVVIFASQQTQRKTDHAGLMTEHTFDGEMSLAGIGRAEHGPDARRTGNQSHALR